MPIPEQRDLEKTRDVLAEWLGGKVGSGDVEVSEITGPAFTGFSNETLLFDAGWSEGGQHRTQGLVVRVAPTRHHLFLDPDFEFQHRVISALGEHTDVPAPPMRWYEDDEGVLGAPFFVMSKVEGRVPGDAPPYTQAGWVLEEATPAFRRRMVESGLDAMGRIHAVDVDALDLGFLDKRQYGPRGIEQQVNYYERYLEWTAQGRPLPVAEAALEWVRANLPEDQDIRLAWGDARINNQMFDESGDVVAVLDWEMVTLADPMMDLGWWLFLDRHFHEGIPADRLEGFPTREEMVAHYEDCTGRAARDLFFYEVFAGLRFCVIMARLSELLAEFELLPTDSDMATNNIVTRLTAALLDLPSPGEPVPLV
ncbi:MAG TPA: phosphotransferase family protein [Acidimicrobiia bacterium]